MRHLHIIASVILLALTASALSPSRAAAGTDVDLRAGYYTDMEAVSLGGGLLSSLGSRWFFNPNLEMAFGDRVMLSALSADFHYDLPSASMMSFYLGGGPTVLLANPDRGDANTELGMNLLAGVSSLSGQVRPFAQLKAILADNSEVALMGGIRF